MQGWITQLDAFIISGPLNIKKNHTHGAPLFTATAFFMLKRTLIIYSEGTCKQIQYENLAEHHQET